MNTTTNTITATTCATWCTVEHELPGGFHASPDVTNGTIYPARIWQADQDGATAGIVVAGQLPTDGQAHEFGMALVRAADELRRARIEANR